MSQHRHELRRFPWQVRDSGQLLLTAAAGVLLVASVAQTAGTGLNWQKKKKKDKTKKKIRQKKRKKIRNKRDKKYRK
jgi:hypothetical protein